MNTDGALIGFEAELDVRNGVTSSGEASMHLPRLYFQVNSSAHWSMRTGSVLNDNAAHSQSVGVGNPFLIAQQYVSLDLI